MSMPWVKGRPSPGDFGIPTDRLPRAVNNLLSAGQTYRTKSSDVRVLDAREMDKGFHARFDSKGKRYRYIIKNTPEADLFSRNYAYHVKEPLDVEQMRQAAALIVGTHDFACFQSSGGTPRETTVRTVCSLQVEPKAHGEIWIEIAGDGFLYNMVRIIAGTLTEVGLGRKSPADIPLILAEGRRQLGGPYGAGGGAVSGRSVLRRFKRKRGGNIWRNVLTTGSAGTNISWKWQS